MQNYRDTMRKIKKFRTFHGVTLEQIAEELEVTKSTLHRWELGYGRQLDSKKREEIRRAIARVIAKRGRGCV